MNLFSNLRAARDTLYNKVWRSPKGRLSAKLRSLCDGIPQKQRLLVVSIMLCAFVLIAFFVFGHACYKIGLGHSGRLVEVEHIQPLKISKPDVKPITPVAYDDAGMESED
ncbi:TraL conjugative transposon family protein [Duncaniella dubosii]|uniref:TraL conjugative transposon family protein n=1 Tax=Duncaniella dubosii TaxID=2518971 RepID=UPI0023F02E72|nr:TraL conjugative transposon family protein [Duncaniella dubosii]MCX4285370.1 TraL conjugative transposon family protein [Duncaniella dubosii]